MPPYAFLGFAGGLIALWFTVSWKLTSSIEKNIQEARKEKSADIARILVEELDSVTKETHEEIPNEIKKLLTKYYANTFAKIINLPNGLSETERNKDRLNYARNSLMTSIIVFVIGGILSYLGISEAVLSALVIGGGFLIYFLLLASSVIKKIKWT